MKKLLFIILTISILLISQTGYCGVTWTESDTVCTTDTCSRADAVLCFNDSRCTDGDTIVIKAGTCQWDDYVEVHDEVTITGQGTALTETGATTIERYGFLVYSDQNNVRITNIVFDGEHYQEGEWDTTIHAIRMGQYYLGVGADGVANFRIDNNKFKRWGVATQPSRTIVVTGHANGVVYENLFENNYRNNVLVIGDQTPGWTRDGIGGYADATFVEDNEYTFGAGMSPAATATSTRFADGGNGATFVIRFNTFTGTGTYGSMESIVDTHGLCTSAQTGIDRGIYSSEVYGNELNFSGSTWYRFMRSRGGGGFWFNNTMTNPNYGATNIDLDVERERKDCPDIEGWTARCTTYPCQDQIGFPFYGDKDDADLYMWNNTNDGVTPPINKQTTDDSYLVNGRDYYMGTTPTNTYAGWGTRTNRPTCVREGQSYWSTDQGEWNSTNGSTPDGTLDRCNGSLVWVNAWYTPYTYPHPLREETTDEIYANSCSRSDVYSAYQQAVSGDKIIIPAGDCTWTEGITTNKSVSFIGPGKDLLKISGTFGTYSAQPSDPNQFFVIYTDSTDLIEISGMELESNGNASGIKLTSDPETFRITDMRFDRLNHGIWINGDVGNTGDGGVIDNCYFYNTRSNHIKVIGPCSETWTRAGPLGTKEGVYIEDCYFERDQDVYGPSYTQPGNGHITASNSGSRYIVRFSSFKNDYESGYTDNLYAGSLFDAHGYCYDGGNCGGEVRNYGSYSVELYNNTGDVEHAWADSSVRSGKFMVFDNVFTGHDLYYHSNIRLMNYRSWKEDCQVESGNCEDTEGYPCKDQVNNTYVWNNTINDSQFSVIVEATGTSPDSATYHIQEDRDFWQNNSSFDGTSGVGKGIRANRPATCTTGVGYWSTDQGEWDSTNGATPDGTLDKCTSTDTWTNASYTPYTYPHPLREETIGDVTAPTIDWIWPDGDTLTCTYYEATETKLVNIQGVWDEPADTHYCLDDGGVTCDSSTSYADMLSAAVGGVTDTTGGTGFYDDQYVACGDTYTYHIRSQDTSGNESLNTNLVFTVLSGTPTISSPLPTGNQACTSDPRNVVLQISTNINATCKYDTSDTTYALMANPFTTTGGQIHQETVSLDCDDSYTYYTRCSASGNENTTSTPISFTISTVPVITTTRTVNHNDSVSLDCGASYLYYARCKDAYDNVNTVSTEIDFDIVSEPNITSTTGTWDDAESVTIQGTDFGPNVDLAAVKIGNNVTYENTTYTSAQTVVSWNSTNINMTVVQGTFAPSETAWLFVINSSGDASGGYEITFTSVGDTSPPVMSGGQPTILSPVSCTSDPRNVTISLNTNEEAWCRISDTDESYDVMGAGKDMTTGQGTKNHEHVVSNECGIGGTVEYDYYVQCADVVPNKSVTALNINYMVEENPFDPDAPGTTWNCIGTSVGGGTQ